MCGIVGIAGAPRENVVGATIASLKKLEYRGYDSSGAAAFRPGGFEVVKSVGKIAALEAKIPAGFSSSVAIAHTRWATHGVANEANAHPHASSRGDVVVVHNGIIENYAELKEMLIAKGFSFASDTDTEVIANLVSWRMSLGEKVFDAFIRALGQLAGSYAVAMLANGESDRIFAAKRGSPLLLGAGEGRNIVASSLSAISGVGNRIIQLGDGEAAVITASAIETFGKDGRKIEKKIEEIEIDDLHSDKGAFPHFMMKEIFEQPDVFKRIAAEYVDVENSSILLPKFAFDLASIDFMTIVACGTSYHAGCVAKYFIEDFAGVFVNVDIASEFRYRTNPLGKNGLALFISQSGETADTIAALKYCKDARQKIVSIVNVAQSTIASESDMILKTPAGVEVGVASTKALTAQVSLLYLLAVEIAFRNGSISGEKYHAMVAEFAKAGRVLEKALMPEPVEAIEKIAKVFAREADYLIYTGRDILFPMVLEGALKIEEVSYIPTLGVASGELKHGPIALIGDRMFVIALNNSRLLFDKNASSIEEIAARNGRVVLIGDMESYERMRDKVYAFIPTAATDNKFEVLLSQIIPIQLLAYFVSVEKGLDVDKPRNLAKSVTVE